MCSSDLAVLLASLAFGITAFVQYLAAQASAEAAERSAQVARINEERAKRNGQIAAVKVREFDLLSGVVHYQSAIANEKDLFPESPQLVPRLERWLTEHAERLLAMRADVEQTVQELRNRTAYAEGTAIPVEDASQSFLLATLSDLLTKIGRAHV